MVQLRQKILQNGLPPHRVWVFLVVGMRSSVEVIPSSRVTQAEKELDLPARKAQPRETIVPRLIITLAATRRKVSDLLLIYKSGRPLQRGDNLREATSRLTSGYENKTAKLVHFFTLWSARLAKTDRPCIQIGENIVLYSYNGTNGYPTSIARQKLFTGVLASV
ncbi:hypothetical protein KIN20_014230 [Parelaphostrongylus tenuis]|uniref:Uncharacterized protein n=1 Tax=Parelaphostrongylus tenuis TaxID=148309 RepID=A0AAD5MX27_PARTN|nr:hypothetical protein KIN20_014230 [Parelaphostrongylus tenuis]